MPYKDKQKQLEYQNRWTQKRRTDWLRANGPCRHCGSWEDLEVDHIDPKGKHTHRIWTLKESKRNKELRNCQPLCRSCHFDKTGREAIERNKSNDDVRRSIEFIKSIRENGQANGSKGRTPRPPRGQELALLP